MSTQGQRVAARFLSALKKIDDTTDIEFEGSFVKTSPIKAVKMDEPFEVETLEGTMKGEAGDWLAEGVEGERWPIDAEIFGKTYKKEAATRVAARYAELIPGGLAQGKAPSDFDPEELKKGIEVEKEHLVGGGFSEVEVHDMAQEIAMDHLTELPDYYTRLQKVEKKARSYNRIVMFDFDGTLFRSWEETPTWWKGTELDKGPYSFFLTPESLDEPCVPDAPPSNYWIPEAVRGAKEAIHDTGTYTVLITGRVATHEKRVEELLSQKGLIFDKHYFNPGMSAARFKVVVLRNLLAGFNTVSQVEVWENENMKVYDADLRRTAVALDRPVKVEIHHIHVPPHELVCGPKDFGLPSQNTETGEARVASRSPNHVLVSPLKKGLMPVDIFFGEVRERPDRHSLVTGEMVRTDSGDVVYVVGVDDAGEPILAANERQLAVKKKMLDQTRLRVARLSKTAGKGVGLFLPLPESLAQQFPKKKKEDTSPPHVTFLYIGEVPKDREDEFLSVLETAFSEIGPVSAVLDGLDSFVNQVNKVVFSRIRLSKDLSKLRDRVWRKLTDAGFKVDDSFPRWNPHTTISYLDDPRGVWDGKAPVGKWDFSSIEIWGLSRKHVIPFGEPVSLRSPLPEIGLQRVARIMRKRANEISLRQARG